MSLAVLDTPRLTLRRLTEADAPFILRLLNEPSWLRFIGDKGVRNLDDARRYLREGPLDMYARLGFGLYHVSTKHDATPVGMCGLIKRDALSDVDIGFAYVPESWGNGYAVEAAHVVVRHARDDFALKRLVAIASPDNTASIRVLTKIGLAFERLLELAPGNTVKLFGRSL